ncbi:MULTISPECIES: ExeA family protein [Idiomarina]|mgnify:CR=1 FL=1|jgi:general secretion pathway protein A|uniref:ExeA family protein n=1 Tax=Idiomarina TaxID=135575 RepID=UPI000C0B36A0|nr:MULTISPECIES: ExeA family protein [Idiomarina]MAC33388.1 general secretion pathway protein [Haliea sp.]MAO69155.1 general secretion pathway protein [Idiomarina sp.]MBF81748.1 general secretion pathway protein [Idiomarina sp.]|tara:strand:+ start:8231 stop:9649 length:1419 start_codon:yes stop_codon:yes gene_type:complete
MYQNYFGLQAEPFSIAPDPNYLYLSERHQEALAHLTQGLQGSGGFILLTGEVGTGKTTVSRALLEQLPESTETAFILNPMLNEDELLASLCDEFGIRYQKRSATRKTLTDKLSQFFLKANDDGRQCVVLIDEAQHLRPQVLEQLRLLTNLETHDRKLLRVILIGQPELQDLLRRQELRQLAQRITARYHILPLTEQDTQRYIAYRLQVSGANRPLFTAAAARKAHQLTQGIPRLLNLYCDRALLAAYTESSSEVQPKHLQQAHSELNGTTGTGRARQQRSPLWRWAGAFTLLVAAAVGSYSMVKQTTVLPPTTDADQYLAAKSLASVWGLPEPSTEENFCQWVQQYDLACLELNQSLQQLRRINYPALLYKRDKEFELITDGTAIDTNGWNGAFLILYQQPFTENVEAHEQWVREQLTEHLGSEWRTKSSTEQLQALQRRQGLRVTGKLDEATMAWLASRASDFGPRLSKEG